jgi:dihydrofolate reductase
MGGADVGRQYLRAGLIDEVQIHLVPVVLAARRRCSTMSAGST